jgi:MATE family multidrug resistance protein
VLVGRFGEVQIAAHQIALNFSSLVFMFPMGSVGGHHDPRRAFVRGRRRAGGTLIAWAGVARRLDHRDPGDRPIICCGIRSRRPTAATLRWQALAANLLLFAAFWQLFDATQVCAIGALRGYKVTLMPMLLMLTAFWAIGVPTGTWLAYRGLVIGEPMKVYGFWAGLVIGLVRCRSASRSDCGRVADAAMQGNDNHRRTTASPAIM